MRSAHRFLAALFAVAALLAVLAPTVSARRAPVVVEADLLQRINDARAAAGRAPLAGDGRLATLSGRHATTMARAGTMMHAPYSRILKTVGARRAGEVVAIGFTPADVVNAWLASGVHRSILLDRRFSMAGAGVAAGTLNGAFAWYVTVDLAG